MGLTVLCCLGRQPRGTIHSSRWERDSEAFYWGSFSGNYLFQRVETRREDGFYWDSFSDKAGVSLCELR